MKSLQKLFDDPSKRKKALLIISGLLITIGWVVDYYRESARLFNVLMLLATLAAGFEIARSAWQGLRNRHTNIELLVTIAAAGGIFIGVFWEAAAVTFLFLLGGWLEARTMSRTRNTLKELIKMAPDTALVEENGGRKEIPARQLEEEMLVLVKPGSKIPVDGMVESGSTSVDESTITGEPMPVEKGEGSNVFAGTINKNGRIYVRASRAGSDTTLAKIIHRVEEAQEEKAPSQRFIERFARWYTPGIVGLSIGSYLLSGNLELALTLLVIGCPGALVISTPVSIISGIGRAAEKGILIKGGEHLEQAGKITAVAFDKTGTITEGKPRITDLFSLQRSTVMAGAADIGGKNQKTVLHWELSADEEDFQQAEEPFRRLLYCAGIAESVSEHPLGQAILKEAEKAGAIPEPDRFKAHTGMGVEAHYHSDTFIAGSPDFIRQNDIKVEGEVPELMQELSEAGRTLVLIARNGELMGGIGITDRMRPEAPAMIGELRRNGTRETVMLTGDAAPVARNIAEEAGINWADVHAGLLPEEKTEIIQQLQKKGHKVAMVGDGINDAPALATADIGIAMGAAGTDVAIETADIALMTDELMRIPEALFLSRKALRNISQNVVIALVTVAALLAGVFTGSVHMAGGMLIHELSVMVVLVNGMRLRWA